MHRQAKTFGTARQCPADAPHANNAKPLAPDTMPQHGCWRPATPFAAADHAFTFGHATRYRKNQRHRHVGGVFGQDIGCVGHGDAARPCGLQIDMVNTRPEIGDQAQIRPRMGKNGGIDSVRHRRDKNIGLFDRLDQFGLGHRDIVDVQTCIKQFHHAGFNRFRQFAGHDDEGFFLGHLPFLCGLLTLLLTRWVSCAKCALAAMQ